LQRNLDFPLNLGYNEHFKYHAQIMTLASSLRLAVRRRALERTFRAKYEDLLKAISQDNYESLE